MFHRAGLAYVYRSYGVHFCLNIVTGEEGTGEAVLIRALEPLEGLEAMALARGFQPEAPPRQFCSGPGKLTAALGITLEHDGCDLLEPRSALQLFSGDPVAESAILRTPRIGISQAMDWPRRFTIAGCPWESRSGKRQD